MNGPKVLRKQRQLQMEDPRFARRFRGHGAAARDVVDQFDDERKLLIQGSGYHRKTEVVEYAEERISG